MEGFKKTPWVESKEGLAKALGFRKRYQENIVNFGIKFLDDAFGGIFPDDLMVVTAGTGVGKTEIVTSIACHNAQLGKRVHYFALEAADGEIQNRILYKKLAEAFYIQQDWKTYGDVPNYRSWVQGKQDKLFDKFMPEVTEILENELKTFLVRYRDSDFTAKDFFIESSAIQDETDLIILDHLHYLDAEENSRNEYLSDAMKKIKDTSQLMQKPILLVVHIRKQDRKYKTLIPSLDDVFGTSNIGKICTTAFTIAKVPSDAAPAKYLYPTYFKVQKSRLEGTSVNMVAKVNFDIRKNSYEKYYELGFLSIDETEFKEIDRLNYPRWAQAPSMFDRSE